MDWLLLKKVSRSFYLTLRLLPAPVQETISLAYLLARLSDTEADGVQTEGEAELLARKDELLGWLSQARDCREIEGVWATIREGQAYDGQRFLTPDGEKPDPLTGKELERYTYLVAGCVGEFWTEICFRHLHKFSRHSEEEMTLWGIRFGQGLQLINILRDRAADARLGRIYVAAESWNATIQWTQACLEDAERYVRAVRPWRARAACALPLLLAQETLDLVESNPQAAKVKVSRGRVWILLLRALLYPRKSS